MTRVARHFDGSGRTFLRSPAASSAGRFLIGHLGSSMLLAESNSDLGDHVRLIGASHGHLMVLASGVGSGGGAAGAAAETAVRGMARHFVQVAPSYLARGEERDRTIRRELDAAVDRCRREIVESDRDDGDEPAGATLTAALVLWPRLHLVHLGDGRGYLLRGGEVRRLTDDHVRRVPGGAGGARSGDVMLTSALGAGVRRPTIDHVAVDLEGDDALVFCCKGLVAGLGGDDRRIAEVAGTGPASRSVDALVEAAHAESDPPEATAVVARFRATSPRSVPVGRSDRRGSSSEPFPDRCELTNEKPEASRRLHRPTRPC
ncbi:MAG: PP2C family protein-serine/threonine phosphatase [Planctomycetota bacterium JB042]